MSLKIGNLDVPQDIFLYMVHKNSLLKEGGTLACLNRQFCDFLSKKTHLYGLKVRLGQDYYHVSFRLKLFLMRQGLDHNSIQDTLLKNFYDLEKNILEGKYQVSCELLPGTKPLPVNDEYILLRTSGYFTELFHLSSKQSLLSCDKHGCYTEYKDGHFDDDNVTFSTKGWMINYIDNKAVVTPFFSDAVSQDNYILQIDQQWVISAQRDHSLKIWDLSELDTCIYTLPKAIKFEEEYDHENDVYTRKCENKIIMNQDKIGIFSWNDFKIWDLKTQKIIKTFSQEAFRKNGFAFIDEDYDEILTSCSFFNHFIVTHGYKQENGFVEVNFYDLNTDQTMRLALPQHANFIGFFLNQILYVLEGKFYLKKILGQEGDRLLFDSDLKGRLSCKQVTPGKLVIATKDNQIYFLELNLKKLLPLNLLEPIQVDFLDCTWADHSLFIFKNTFFNGSWGTKIHRFIFS